MITRDITVTIPGHPTPKGSMKCVGKRGRSNHQLVEDERPGQKKWRRLIAEVFSKRVTQRADELQPIGIEVTFVVDRPKVHHVAGDRSRPLKGDAPAFPTRQNTNDLDKMLRLLDDALQDSGLLVDDAQVVELVARKAYPGCVRTIGALPHPGARILVYPIEQEES